MNRWYARLSAGVLALVICFTIASYFIGCSKDETGPTNPVINFQDQYFSIAVGNGNDTVHSGNNLVLLDWQNDTPAATKVFPYYNAYAPTPVIDGIADDEVWASAPETVVNLTLISEGVEPPPGSTPDPTDHDPITQVRIKAVYNWINPNIYFLITWQDPSLDNKKDAYEKESGASAAAVWSTRLDYDQDWVCMMWSTWQWHLDAGGNRDDLAELTTDFQNSGCNSTCHESARPYHLNGTMEDPFNPGDTISQMCDFWFWGASITNYGGPTTAEDPIPGWLVDGFVDDVSGIIGDYNDPNATDPDGLKYAYDKKYFCFQNDKGTPGYQHNTKLVASVYSAEWMDNNQADDFRIFHPYLWLSDAETETFVGSNPGWAVGDKVSGYINRAALGAAAQVFGLATYDDTTQTWTLEINRVLDTGDVNDCILDIYDPHDYQ